MAMDNGSPSLSLGQSSFHMKESRDLINISKVVTKEDRFTVPFGNIGGELEALGNVNTFVGFASAIIAVFWFGFSMATPPKYTVDDVMKKMDNEFLEVKNELDKLKN